MPLAQAVTFWSDTPYSQPIFIKVLIGIVFGFALIYGLTLLPTALRKPIVAAATFIGGAFFVLSYIWPAAIDRKPNDLPVGPVETFSFTLQDSVGVFTTFAQIITGLLLGLGVYSLVRIHLQKIVKQQKDWVFSTVLLVSMVSLAIAGIIDFNSKQGEGAKRLEDSVNWGPANYVTDFLYVGLLQQMDAVMFSIIAFFILSAAYRAFRVRSVEATILLGSALIVIFSLLGAVVGGLDAFIQGLAGNDPNAFILNFKLSEIANWLRSTLQTPSLQAVRFGIGIGALTMGLRLWLSIEKSEGN